MSAGEQRSREPLRGRSHRLAQSGSRGSYGLTPRRHQFVIAGARCLAATAMLAAMGRAASPQQQPVVYVGQDPALANNNVLFLINPDGTNRFQIPVRLAALLGPRWSRDAKLITAWGVDPLNPQGTIPQVFAFDPAGNHVVQVTNISVDANAQIGWSVYTLFGAFSPRGDSIGVAVQFISNQTGARYGAFLTYAFNGAGWIPTIVAPPVLIDRLYSLWGLDWAPRGNLVIAPVEAVVTCPIGSPGYGLPQTPTEIFAAAPVPNAPSTRITSASASADCAANPLLGLQFFSALPMFSPDGSQIGYAQFVYQAGTPVTAALRVVNLDGTNDHVVATIPNALISSVDWSPDGRQLIYGPVPIVGGVPALAQTTVWIVNTDGTGARQLVGPPAGGPSWSRVFPAPTLAALAPAQATAGGAAFTLTLRGGNFALGSVVRWNGGNRATTFDSATKLEAVIVASDIAQAGIAQLTVFTPAPGGGTSSPLPFTISPGAATELAFTGQPSTATAGVAVAPAVQVTARDPSGNTATSFTGIVTVALGANPGGGTLSGRTTAAAVNGVTTFANLSIDKASAGYILLARATGLAAATSAPFTITAAPAPAVTLSLNKVTFGAQLVGTTSAAQPITVNNAGTAALSITDVGVTKNGGATGSFVETDRCVGNVAAGASCTISLTFKATGVGAASGTVTISDNAADAPQTVALSATGADFSFAAAPGGSTTATVMAGQTASYTLAVQPSGYSGTVSLTCSGAPPAATCSSSPAGVDVSATSPVSFTIAVTTAARSQMAAGTMVGPPVESNPIPGPPRLVVALALLGMLVLQVVAWRPRARPCGVVTLLLAVALSHCGAGAGPTQPSGGTPAGTYTLVVTGSSGGVTRTINLTLQVN